MHDRAGLNPDTGDGVIATARLSIAPLTEADATALAVITDDPAIIRRVDFLAAPFGPAEARALIAGDPGFHGVRLRADGALIGMIGIHRRPDDGALPCFEIGYWIGTAWQRRGYAREALTAVLAILAGASIHAECHPDNHASWSLLTSVGFRASGQPGRRHQREKLNYRPVP